MQRGGALASARDAAFSTLVVAELLRAFGARSDAKLVSEVGLLSNLRLFVIVAVSFALQIAIHHSDTLGRVFGIAPVSWSECLGWIGLGCIPLVALETRKAWRRRASERQGA
jgi:Ca2+-transporting ATPase